MPLATGSRLGRYEILSRLGAGGMAEVYRARDTRLERTVALKVLSASATGDARRLERFRQEARAVSRLSHPHICTLHDVGEQDGTSFLVIEHVEGRTLASRLDEGPLPVEELLRHGTQIADALHAAHRAGVIHRDLTPANVMLTSEGVKLLDFGLARLKVAEEGPDDASSTVSHLTEEGEVVGTLPYMAPEQLEGKKADARTDIFALGAVLYQMATGRRPFLATSRASLIAAILTSEPQPLSELQPLAPPDLEWVVKRCLAKNPDGRWQSAQDVAAQLRRIAEGGSRTVRPARRRARVVGTALAATCAALAVALIARSYMRASLSPVHSLAVLPLDNLSGDPQEDYLADGMTDALITRLAQIGSVKVISRTSVMRYKGAERPIPEIARELGVDAVLEGSLLRSGDRVRITAQLVDGATDAHLWAESYEGDMKDVIALQAQVAGAITAEIRAAVTPGERERLRAARAVDPEAYKAYLRGRHLFGKGDPASIEAAIGRFREAIDRDPSFAPAYAGLAQVYSELGGAAAIPGEEARLKVRAAARKALEIDPQLAEAYSPLAWATVAYDWDWAEGERLFRKALELKPNDADGHRLYSDYLKCTGRNEEAVAEARRARELDPFSATVDYQLGNVLYFTRRYDEAIAVLRAPREGTPLVAQILLGFAYMQKNEHEKARAAFVAVRDMAPPNPSFLTPLAAGSAAAGRQPEARALLVQIENAKGLVAFPVAFIHARLGDKDRAFAWLEKSYRNREFFMGCLRAWPELDPLRSDPRYEALVERMRFPPWGQPAGPR